MTEATRLRKFLVALDSFISSNCYYDDENEEDVNLFTEEQCYDKLMTNEEFHLLTSKKVKELIHIAYTDFDKWTDICFKYHAFN